MLATDTLTSLKGLRVRVLKTDASETFGLFRSFTADRIFVENDFIPITEVDSVEEAPLFCSVCGEKAMRLFDGMCAADYRTEAARRPAHREPCEVCGAPGVRNVRVRRSQFLCALHHAETGEGLLIHPAAQATIADCATADVTSDKHEWGQVRGARFRCVRCKKAEKWDTELLAELQGKRGYSR